MRKITGGVVHLADQIDKELSMRGVKVSLPQRRALSDISASILSCQSVNTTEIANISLIDVMSPLAEEAIE